MELGSSYNIATIIGDNKFCLGGIYFMKKIFDKITPKRWVDADSKYEYEVFYDDINNKIELAQYDYETGEHIDSYDYE